MGAIVLRAHLQLVCKKHAENLFNPIITVGGTGHIKTGAVLSSTSEKLPCSTQDIFRKKSFTSTIMAQANLQYVRNESTKD